MEDHFASLAHYDKLYENIYDDATIEDKGKAIFKLCETMYTEGEYPIENIYYFLKENEFPFISELIIDMFEEGYF